MPGIGIFLLFCILIRLLTSEDRTGPIITYAENSFVYTEDEPKDTLLKNVSAKDERDGDVTNTIMVENILPMLDSSTAKITYVAKDSNNNITRKEVIVPYKPKTDSQGNKSTLITESKGNTGNLSDIENTAGVKADTKVSARLKDRDTTKVADVKKTGKIKEITLAEDTSDPVTGPAVNPVKTSASDKYPSLKLKTHEVKLKRGEKFDALSYVDKIVDDKDNNYYLFQRIHIIGYFNMDKAGDYVLLYYAMDSDNNESGKEYLWLDVRQ